MNKLYIVNDNIQTKEIDDTLIIEYDACDDFFKVSKIKIEVLKDTSLQIEHLLEEKSKINIIINVREGVKFNLEELRKGSKVKIQYIYNLEEESSINIERLSNSDKINEYDIANLNGRNANIKLLIKTIATAKEKYDIILNHNFSNTYSEVINHGLSINDGAITFNTTGIIPLGNKGCISNEFNRIININNGKNKITPTFIVDEFDVEANHNAFIGKFSDEEIFYLQSRGISLEEANNLLTKGFLSSSINSNYLGKEIIKTVDKYWG